MLSPYVTKLIKETGKTQKEIEDSWNQAKEITAETLGKSEDKFGKVEYDYAYGIVMNMLGKKEAVLNPEVFMSSDKSAREFIEDVISGDFKIGDDNPIINKKKDDDEEESSEEDKDDQESENA